MPSTAPVTLARTMEGMHIVHFAAVTAESADHARSLVTSALEERADGTWWDWFDVGGRWEAAFMNVEPGEEPSDAVAPNATHLGTQAGRKALERVAAWQDKEWQSLRDDILGLHPPVSAQGRTPFGADFAANAAAALMSPSPAVSGPVASGANMWFWRVETAGKLMSGAWTVDSHFIDLDPDVWDRTADPRMLLARLDAGEDLSNKWLVVVDFHY